MVLTGNRWLQEIMQWTRIKYNIGTGNIRMDKRQITGEDAKEKE